MATIYDSLKGINGYPIPKQTILDIATINGLDSTSESNTEVLQSEAFKSAKADILSWLALAPKVVQNDIAYSFTDEQRIDFSQAAAEIRSSNEGSATVSSIYGYKGSRL